MNRLLFCYTIFFYSLLCMVSCEHHDAKTVEDTTDVIDSIRIYYEWYPGVFVPEFETLCKEHIVDYKIGDKYVHSLFVNDSLGILTLSTAIDSLVCVRNLYYREGVAGPAVLLIYKKEVIDTISLLYHPGEVLINGTTFGNKRYKDSFLWKTTYRLISERDSLWKDSFFDKLFQVYF